MKKILTTIVGVFLCILTLVSCSGGNSEITVTDFKPLKQEYDRLETVNFNVGFHNPKRHKIKSVVIDGAKYSVSLETTNTAGLISTDIKAFGQPDKKSFRLESFTYIDAKEGKEIEVKETRSCNIMLKTYKGNALLVNNFSTVKQKQEFVLNQESVAVNLGISISDKYVSKDDILKVRRINFAIENAKFNSEANTMVGTGKVRYFDYALNHKETPNLTLTNKFFKTEINLSSEKEFKKIISEYGYFIIKIESIEYTNEMEPGKTFKAENISNDSNTVKISVKAPRFYVSTFEVDKTVTENNKTTIEKDFEGNLVIEKGKTVILNLVMTAYALTNEEPVVQFIKINGVILKPIESRYSSGKIFSSFSINIDNSEKGIKEVDLKINEILLSNHQHFVYEEGVKLNNVSKKVLSYDKIVSEEKDLEKLKYNDSIFLSKDITMTKRKFLFETNETFTGVFEGNGKTITSNSGSNIDKPMFNQIGENAIVKNLAIEGATKNTNFIAKVNKGTIKNISVKWIANYRDFNYKANNSGLLGINEGKIYDLHVESVNLSYKITEGDTSFSLVANTNSGEIARVVIGNLIGSPENSGSAIKTELYLISKENKGVIRSIVVDMFNFESKKVGLTFQSFTIRFKHSAGEGNNETFFVNENILLEEYYENQIISETDPRKYATTKDLGRGTLIEKSVFFGSLGFTRDEQNNFWNLGDAGSIKLRFR